MSNTVDIKAKVAKLLFIKGPSGPSIYLNDYRIAGPKPWGGGEVVYEFEVSHPDILLALNTKLEKNEKN